MLMVISPFEKVTGCWESKCSMSTWESSQSLWVKLVFSFSCLSHFACHIVQFYVLPVFSKNVFPCFASSHSPWTNCLCYPLTFPCDFYLLSLLYKVQCCSSSAPLFSQLFMWERPELLKPEATTKTRANDQDCCQSNTQAFQRCKQMCACTKGRSRSLFTVSTLRTQSPFAQKHNMHMQTPDSVFERKIPPFR